MPQHDPDDQPARVGGQVESVLHRDEDPVGCLDALDRGEAVRQRSAEAIELGDDEAVAGSRLDSAERLRQARTVRPSARHVELLEDVPYVGASRRSPRLDLLALHDGREKALAPAPAYLRDTDVPIDDHAHHFVAGRASPPR